MECFAISGTHVINWPSRCPDSNILGNAFSIESNLFHHGPQPRNVTEYDNRIEKALMDINLRCYNQLVELFDSIPLYIARISKKKGIKNL